jgi:hypothetical protein
VIHNLQATAEIIGGLTAGQMARTPKQRKQVNNKWRKLDFMKVVSEGETHK